MVDTLDDLHLLHRLLRHRLDAVLFGTDDIVLLAILFDQVAERLAIALGLARSDSLDVEQFFLVDRIDGCHLFQGNVLEDDVRRALQFAGHIVAQVLEHGEELRVEHAETSS